jgi:hypothetical protein
MVRAAHPSSYDAPASSPAPAAVASPGPGGAAGERPSQRGVPKPTSEKRVAANRANARKSTGPRTAAGRARSRLNALKHGLCARVVLLPGEDWREYQAFAKHFADDLKPLGVIQEMLAGRAAALAWALQRLPDAASDLAERGERHRFAHWFHGRGLRDRFDVMYTREYRGKDPLTGPDDWRAMADAELAAARAEGSPPPADRDAAGVVADAVAGDEAFAAVLKLEEHERRLWSALLSVLRSLERRQKVDGRAEGDPEPDGEPDGNTDVEQDGEEVSGGVECKEDEVAASPEPLASDTPPAVDELPTAERPANRSDVALTEVREVMVPGPSCAEGKADACADDAPARNEPDPGGARHAPDRSARPPAAYAPARNEANDVAGDAATHLSVLGEVDVESGGATDQT